jgi:hypothetical protein
LLSIVFVAIYSDIQFWAQCDLKWSSDGLLTKVKLIVTWNEAVMDIWKNKDKTTDDKWLQIEIVARFDTDYFFIESFRKQ